MMITKLLLKHKIEILVSVLLVIFYFATRLPNLLSFPIFTDEAIYVRWTQIGLNDANWRFISLTDGKQPSFVWLGMVFLKLFQEPLLSLRLVSVVSGLFVMGGLFFLTYELFKNKWTALLSSFLYVVFPFAVVYDRLALYDSLLAVFVVWATYFAVLLARKIRLDIAFFLGFAIGGAMLTKSSGVFSAYLLPVTLFLFDFKNKKWKENLIKWGFLALFAFILAEGFYNVIKLSPFAHIIGEKNTIFVYTFSEWLSNPFVNTLGNFKGLSDWLFTYLTPFFVFFILVSFATIKKFPKEKLLLLFYFVLPFAALTLFGKVIFPRFIFFMSISLIPLVSVGLTEVILWSHNFLKKRGIDSIWGVSTLIIIFFILYPLKVSLDFVFNPKNVAIASADREQYISGWPSGGGIKESIEFFKKEAEDKKIFIATEGTFGLMPYALDIYLGDNKNITTKGYWPIEEFPEELLEQGDMSPVYFVFYQPCPGCEFPGDAPDSWPLKLISKYKKGENTFYSIYSLEQ